MEITENSKPRANSASCYHCGEQVSSRDTIHFSGHSFCCNGCKTVYHLLQDHSLEQYYSIRASDNLLPSSLKTRGGVNYHYLDDASFRDNYFPIKNSSQREGRFYIEGIHCHACLWLMEKLPLFLPEIIRVEFNLGRFELSVLAKNDFQFSTLANLLFDLGYKACPLKKDDSTQKFIEKENKKWLYRIAVAAACMGNIMLFAISNYAGAQGHWSQLFDRLSALLFIPVFFYSAYPLYKSAWGRLKLRQFSIDFPLVLAIVLGSVLSYYHLFIQSSQVYFDTLTTLIFLILSSRYILRLIQQKNQSLIDREVPFAKNVIQVWRESWQSINLDQVEEGDTILCEKGEILPFDGLLLSNAVLDLSLITGESNPIIAQVNSTVLAGSRNLKNDFQLRVTKRYAEGQLGSMIDELKKQWHEYRPFQGQTDQLATRLLQIIIISAILVLGYFGGLQSDWATAFTRSLALLIIACPCALGLGAPLVFSLGLRHLFKRKIFVRSGQELEKLFAPKHIFFDKTGTLTTDEPRVKQWKGQSHQSLIDAVYTLEELSQHPLGKGICQYLSKRGAKSLEHIQQLDETPGEGIQGKIQGLVYKIGRFDSSLKPGEVGVWENNQLVATIEFEQKLNSIAKKFIQWLKKQNAEIYILTGDERLIAMEKAKQLGVKRENVHAKCLPKVKRDIIARHDSTIMIGDGINDSLALSYADVGIGLKGVLPVKVKDANINVEHGGLANVFVLFRYAQKLKNSLRATLIFSIGFNLIGIILAFLGYITPLAAAVLMPISSLTVVAIALIGTKLDNTKIFWDK